MKKRNTIATVIKKSTSPAKIIDYDGDTIDPDDIFDQHFQDKNTVNLAPAENSKESKSMRFLHGAKEKALSFK